MKYHMYKYVNNDWYYYRNFDNYDDLLSFLHYYQQDDRFYRLSMGGNNKWNNTILDDINMSGHDISYDYERCRENDVLRYIRVPYIRPYMFFDEYNRVVDVRHFFSGIKNFKENSRRFHWSWRGTKSVYSPSQNVKRGQLIRMLNHPDFKEYGRLGKYKYIDHWDYPRKHCDRSWKTSYKCRKQWMKNMK